MASTSMIINIPKNIKGKVVVASSPSEFHEIGAWIISDILESNGWDVKYLGANTPKKDLISLLSSFKPNVLALSVTMPFNILKTKDVIDTIKKDENLKNISIIVGGSAFNQTKELWRSTGADLYARNLLEAKELLNNLEIL